MRELSQLLYNVINQLDSLSSCNALSAKLTNSSVPRGKIVSSRLNSMKYQDVIQKWIRITVHTSESIHIHNRKTHMDGARILNL